MKKWAIIVLALAMLSFFSYGCSGTLKHTKTRCPKCAGFFDTREGEQNFEWMQPH
jgi:hypothetical protein